jgi:hypothetical protein
MFVRGANPIWYLPDLTGLPLNDQYYAFFLTNTLPYLPQNVYRDDQGMSVWTNDIVQFFPNGTLPDNLYFDPNLVYRIEIRMGNTQNDPLIYEINDYVPGQATSDITSPLPILVAENQINNSNFGIVNFAPITNGGLPTFVITGAGTYQIAPDWFLVLNGSGTTTITQEIYSGAGANTQPNAINYALQFANAGWTTAVLVQQFNRNGAIFGGGAINMSVLAMAVSGSVTIAINYVTSFGTIIPVLPTTVVPLGNYATYSATINLPPSDNTNLSNVAFTQMQIVLPTTGTIDITDAEMVGQNTPIIDPATGVPFPVGTVIPTVSPQYQQITEEQQVSRLFHYYSFSILVLPKTSLLTGWNFSLNPYQFVTTALTTQSSQCVYVADQTILYSKTASSLKTGQFNATNERFGFQVQAVGAGSPVDNRFALIQYIDPKTIGPYWSYILSSLVRMALFSGFSTNIRMKMRLIWRTNLPPTLSPIEPIASWALNSDPIFSAGWTSIAPLNDPEFFVPVELSNGNYFPIAINNFQLPLQAAAAQTLGIVFYSMDPLNNTMANPDSIVFDKISLCANEFAVDTQAETFDKALLDCQYYYRKSYSQGVLPGTPTANGASTMITVTNYGSGVLFYTERYTIMRAIPSQALLYSSNSGAAGKIFDVGLPGDIFGVTANVSDNSFMVETGSGVATVADTLQWQYTVDARLGV